MGGDVCAAAIMLGQGLCCHCVGILNIWTWSTVVVVGSASHITSPASGSYKTLGEWFEELCLSI